MAPQAPSPGTPGAAFQRGDSDPYLPRTHDKPDQQDQVNNCDSLSTHACCPWLVSGRNSSAGVHLGEDSQRQDGGVGLWRYGGDFRRRRAAWVVVASVVQSGGTTRNVCEAHGRRSGDRYRSRHVSADVRGRAGQRRPVGPAPAVPELPAWSGWTGERAAGKSGSGAHAFPVLRARKPQRRRRAAVMRVINNGAHPRSRGC